MPAAGRRNDVLGIGVPGLVLKAADEKPAAGRAGGEEDGDEDELKGTAHARLVL